MQMWDLHEAIDQLANTCCVRWYGCVLRNSKDSVLGTAQNIVAKQAMKRVDQRRPGNISSRWECKGGAEQM